MARPEGPKQPVSSPTAERRRKATVAAPTAHDRGRSRRRGSSSGPLAPAVVQVLKAEGAPMGVAEILEGLRANGYRYAAADPKKNLAPIAHKPWFRTPE